ncbi:MAG: xylan 1,4-beta-xylosidase [Bacteroidales bacterium]|nr:xylan 1,4-beta-xylosidase [Bacteroidales bacterium]
MKKEKLFGKNEEKRFRVDEEQGLLTNYRIIVDNETGVNYLFVACGEAGGITPLLDKDGKPIVTPVYLD